MQWQRVSMSQVFAIKVTGMFPIMVKSQHTDSVYFQYKSWESMSKFKSTSSVAAATSSVAAAVVVSAACCWGRQPSSFCFSTWIQWALEWALTGLSPTDCLGHGQRITWWRLSLNPVSNWLRDGCSGLSRPWTARRTGDSGRAPSSQHLVPITSPWPCTCCAPGTQFHHSQQWSWHTPGSLRRALARAWSPWLVPYFWDYRVFPCIGWGCWE